MNYSQELREAMVSLTDRYGITLTEVPERFKEKLVQMIGSAHHEEIEHAFKPLEAGALRNFRIRATHRIEPKKLAEARDMIAAVEGYSHEDVIASIHLWVEIFKVNPDTNIDELEEADLTIDENSVEFIDDVSPIIDNTSITAPYDVERVVNQFDTTVPVDEPQVEDYDGKFSDTSFETVADFTMTKEEINLNAHLQSDANSPGYDDFSKTLEANKKSKKRAKKNETAKPHFEPEPVNYEPPGYERNTAEGNVDGAFRALRDGNPGLASRIMMELARNGDTRAQFHLGEFYLNGTGIEKSLEKAKYWLRKAAGRGSVAARSKLEEIENEANSGGCCGCLVSRVVILIVMRLLSALI